MAKSKKSKRKQKAKAKARAVTTAVMRMPALPRVPIGLAMETCSVTNPFCPEAVGARWPDNSYSKSVGWSVTNKAAPYTMQTDAGGNAANMFFPDPYNSTGVTSAAWAGTTATFTGTSMTYVAAPPSNVVRWRITSWGFRISGVMAPLNASGTLRVRLFSPMNGSTLNVVDVTTTMADASMDIPLSRLSNKDVFVIPMPLGVGARVFQGIPPAPGTGFANWNNLAQWQVVLISVTGAPAATVACVIQCYYNFEFVFADGDASTAFAQPPPMSSPVVRQSNAGVLERIGNFVEGTVAGVDRLFQNRAVQALAAGVAGGMAGGPAGAAAGVLTVYAGNRGPRGGRRVGMSGPIPEVD